MTTISTEYIYKDAAGAVLGKIFRHDNGSEKTFRTSKDFPKAPRPLYGLDRLSARPGAPVIVVEGEKTADAAGSLFPDCVVVTSSHGSKAANKADWSPLAGRDVVIWRDNDKAGAAYALAVFKLVPHARVVDIPSGFPDGWDLADNLPTGITVERLRAMIDGAVNPKPRGKGNGKADTPPLSEREKMIARIKALQAKTVENGCTKAEADAAAAKAKALMNEHGIDPLESGMTDVGNEEDTKEQLRESAKDIIACGDVLSLFEAAWTKMVAGEVKNAKLLYLVATSRLFPKAMHAAIKGPSSAGKSEIRKRVLAFFPPEHIISFTTLSEKALLYFERDFCHMVLSMGEAWGAEEQQLQDYLLRELMSEDVLRYPVVQQVGGALVTTVIEKHGPVCFLVTTTKNALNAENETRALSLEVDDSAAQTTAVLDKVAEIIGLNIKTEGAEIVQWRDFQRWLATGNLNVVVPYARSLAALIAPRAVRLRRDLGQILMAIKSHALLHREHRYIDGVEIVATLDDYAAVAALMSDIVAETSEVKVSSRIRETVAAVEKLQSKAEADGQVTAKTVGAELRLDRSSAYRRLQSAVDLGLIRNLETRERQPGNYRTEPKDKDAQELMPSVEQLAERWANDAA